MNKTKLLLGMIGFSSILLISAWGRDKYNNQECRPFAELVMAEEYRDFLSGKVEIDNPYNPEYKISVFNEFEVEGNGQREKANKFFALLDVNGDKKEELIFKMSLYNDEVLLLLNFENGVWSVYDIFETHTRHMAFSINDKGIVRWGQNHTGNEEIYYCYNESGEAEKLIHFCSSETWLMEQNADAGYYYEYYYLGGKESEPVYLNHADEYESLISAFRGDELNWYSLDQ